MEYNSFSGVIRWKYIASYLITLTISVDIFKIFTNQINSQNFDLENMVKVNKKNGTFAIPLEIFDSYTVKLSEI